MIRFPAGMDGELHSVTVTIGGELGNKKVRYPLIRVPWWYWAGPLALIVLIGGIVFLLLRMRSPGRLVFTEGPLAGDTITLKAGTTRIGALPDNDIVLSDASVSRNHVEIHARGKRVEVQDLHSSNGTLVNGAAVKACPVQPGDRIQIGRVEMVFDR